MSERRYQSATHLVVAAATAIASFVLAAAVLADLPDLIGKPTARLPAPAFETPRDAYFDNVGNEALGQIVLYHDLGSSIEHARAADVLFVGSSRAALGLVSEVMDEQARRLGLSVFSLACGHSENVSFALELIRRHDLRPRLVVVEGGPFVFSDGLSEMAKLAVSMTRWEAWRFWVERRASWALLSRLHRQLPRIDLLGLDRHLQWVVYRSERTGWWLPVVHPTSRYAIGFEEEAKSYQRYLTKARELRDEIAARGGSVILTTIPYGWTEYGHLVYLEKELGLPWVLPSFSDLYTLDGSHLTRESARRTSYALWEKLMSHPAVRTSLGLGEPGAG